MTRLSARVVLAILSVQALMLGLWATWWPRAFYDEFPGFGRQWVLPDGPFNEHLVRDFGALNLALAVVSVMALVTLDRRLVLASGWAWIAWSVPHIVDHVRRRDVFDSPADQASAIGGLILLLALAVLVVAVPVRSREPDPVT